MRWSMGIAGFYEVAGSLASAGQTSTAKITPSIATLHCEQGGFPIRVGRLKKGRVRRENYGKKPNDLDYSLTLLWRF
jgi:hypothetical protein